MHLIFFKGSCQTVFEAESINNGLVTLAYLFNVTENQHFGIDHITTNLSNVRTFGQTARIPVFPLSYLIYNQPCEYFTYLGKIDKRGCKCGITQWIVFTKTFDVNREQVEQFRCMRNKRGHAINRNYRKANPVPPGNNIRPFLVVLDVIDSNSTDGDVVTEEVVMAATDAPTPSIGLRQTSRCRSLAIIASEKGGNSSWTLCVKPTKTQLLRRMYNLNKLSVHKHWPPTAKTIVISSHSQSEPEQKADAESEKHLRSKLSFNYVTRPSWK
ncbi:PREDICTED: uncharacterized protein LOC107162214 [Diuraphis noxia]|uniref:uncharacterized protein LOC107162214 n=1 Tax=Diuraphis noxia TaxID=143948 RepID=UPI000763587E|nr:PREDICTED: uncharacterized protein LOC107162214 [Diuraphis noxia]